MFKRIIPVIFGILLVALIEFSLCLAGKCFLYARNPKGASGNAECDKLILCIGDSHTFGVGAADKYSYPGQLETLLNINNPQVLYKVVNSGVPGNSTRQQIERLGALLKENKTDLVILLTGRNNYFEAKAWGNNSLSMHLLIKLQKMRTYKVLKYALDRYFKIGRRADINAFVEEQKYEDYIRAQLARAKSLCAEHGCPLLLISYYNNHYQCIAKIAEELEIVYLNLYQDSFKNLPQDEVFRLAYIDNSHMNCYGYRIFAQALYKKMYLYREDLALQLNGLSNEIDQAGLCRDAWLSPLRRAQGKSVFY